MKICIVKQDRFAPAFMQALSIYGIDFDIVDKKKCKDYGIILPFRLPLKYSLPIRIVMADNLFYRKIAEFLNFPDYYYEFPHYLISRLGFEKMRGNIWPRDFDAAFSLSFDCDFSKYHPELREILEVLDCFDMKASFACVGQLVNKEKQVYQDIIDNGHEILNHSQNHPSNSETCPNKQFNELSKQQIIREIKDCQTTLKENLNMGCDGFRTPHFSFNHSQEVYPILRDLGLTYSSSTTSTRVLSFGFPYFPSKTNFRIMGEDNSGLIELPVINCPKHVFIPFDMYHDVQLKLPVKDIFSSWKMLLSNSLKYNLHCNVYFDTRYMPLDLGKMLEEVDTNKFWVSLYNQVARWWGENHRTLRGDHKDES